MAITSMANELRTVIEHYGRSSITAMHAESSTDRKVLLFRECVRILAEKFGVAPTSIWGVETTYSPEIDEMLVRVLIRLPFFVDDNLAKVREFLKDDFRRDVIAAAVPNFYQLVEEAIDKKPATEFLYSMPFDRLCNMMGFYNTNSKFPRK